jgi:hypothetical protein
MNGEKGQALPLAILALTIGTLLIAPFLGHAGSSIIGSRVYAETIDYRTACDAGVEHAIWRLLYEDLGDQLPDPGDQIIYQLPETINGATTTVTVTTNSTGGGEPVGTINKTVLDSFIFDGTYCNTPDIIHVSGNIYAIAYEGPGSDGFVKTVAITPDGNITNAAIDTLEFEIEDCYTPSIIHTSGDIYAIAYRGSKKSGFLKTINIADNGDISNSTIDTLEFDSDNGYEPDIVYVSGIYYGIAYSGKKSIGSLVTVTIAADGDISDSTIDSYEFESQSCYEPDIIHISGNYFAIAYRDKNDHGQLVTGTIAPNGDIGDSITDSLEFDNSNAAYPYIINISGNVYAIVYTGSKSNGFVATMAISAAGDISNNVISSYEFDASDGEEPQIIHVVDDIYAIVYQGRQKDGYLITLPIEPNGNIPGTITDTFEYDTSDGYFPDIIEISDGVVAIAYCGPSSRGVLVTIGITTSSGGANAYRIRAAAGDTAIQAHVTVDNITASIIFWQVQ